ncbi:MAG: hypothetical protein AB7S71_20110 [Dongiaceae bacterium]
MRSAEDGMVRARVCSGLGLRRGLFAALLATGLAACAGSSPDAPSAAADASEAATAPSDPAGGPAQRSTAAATAETAAVPVDPAEAATDADASAVEEQAAPAAEASDAAAESGADSDAEVDQPAAAPEPPPPAEPLPAPAGDGNDSAPEDLAAGEGTEADLPPAAPEAAPAPQSAAAETAAVDRLPALPPGSGVASGRPYVTIRFNRSNVGYEPALAAAVRRAVARRPNVAFDLVAVTPQAASAEEAESRAALAQSQAAAVMRSLAALGIGPDRVSLQSWDGPPSDVHEIRLYIR